ncbi:T9SS type A sorting domain-containing protein [bacterium]|nr:T9SS type A sorting domain-containing protein [bacterium]
MAVLTLFLIFLPFITFAETEFEGEVSGEWTTEGSPYVQVGDAEVPADESLTILPGVEVILGEDMRLTCNGIIIAQGTEEDTIRIHGPEGLVSGDLRFTEGEDTLFFTYCRFDSLNRAFYGYGRTLIVDRCSFINIERIELSEGTALFSNNYFYADIQVSEVDLGVPMGQHRGMQRALIENHLTNDVRYVLQEVEEVEFISNEAQRYNDPPADPRYSSVSIRDCQNVLVTDNLNHEIGLTNPFERLESVTIRDNTLNRLTIHQVFNLEVVVQDNIINHLSISQSRATVTDNYILNGMRVTGWNAAVARARLERNVIVECINLGDTCFVELTNNTIVKPHNRSINDELISSMHGNSFQCSVNMTNNILISYSAVTYAVGDDVDYLEGGYNCFWGVEGTYGGRDENLEGDIIQNPVFIGGHPFEYRLQANSPCIDAGDPEMEHDPDGTRADIGAYYYDQDAGMPPAIISRHDMYIGNGMHFRYVARATDEGDRINFEFEGLPDWLEIEENERRDFVSDSVVVSGDVPDDQEDFVFIVHAFDEDEMEDTLSVQVFVYPFTVLTGQIGGVLSVEDSPYLVVDTAWVSTDDSLIIEPGCELYDYNIKYEDRNKSHIIIEGFIRAVGSEQDSIYLGKIENNRNSSIFELNPNPNVRSEFSYCLFKNTGFSSYQSISLTHCRIDSEYVPMYGIDSENIVEDCLFIGGRLRAHGSGNISRNRFFSNGIGEGIKIIENDSIVVDNNQINGSRFNGISIYGGSYMYIHNNMIDSCLGGVYGGISVRGFFDRDISPPFNIKIISNTIKNCNKGLFSYAFRHNIKISNNLVYSGINEGICLLQDTTLIVNNIIADYNTGCKISASPDLHFVSNIGNNLFLDNNVLLDVEYPEVMDGVLQYNSFFGTDTLGDSLEYLGHLIQLNAKGDSCDAGFNIYLDPLTVNTDSLDFHLYEDSPLIDAGNPDSVFFDVDGTVNDIGLYGGPYGEEYEYPSGVGESDIPVPEGFTLDRPYPNPFNISTNFTFNLPAHGIVDINIYDTIGRLIFSDKLNDLQAGSHRYTWQGIDNKGRPLPTGIYYLELTYKGAKLVKRVVLLK